MCVCVNVLCTYVYLCMTTLPEILRMLMDLNTLKNKKNTLKVRFKLHFLIH